MKAALSFTLLSILLGFAAMVPAGALPKPYGLWLSIPLLFASIFVAFTLTMRIADDRLNTINDALAAMTDGKDMFLSWSLYVACMVVATGAIAALIETF